jgi:hypothetical protein
MTAEAEAEPAPAPVEPTESDAKEAAQYWGYLLKSDKCGTELLNRLLSGLAHYIVSLRNFAVRQEAHQDYSDRHTQTNNFEPNDCNDLTPTQLAAFYRAVGGNYDILFVETPASSIGFIYKSLGCLHSIQPSASDDGYKTPSVPALKPRGFVTWQTIQLLLGPEEHVPFLQNAVQQFDIVDPETGSVFPKLLPKAAFPEKPDQAMLDWYESVSERLRIEAERVPLTDAVRVSLDVAATESASESAGESGDERTEAAKYLSNPMYRDHAGRPSIVRTHSRPSQRQTLEDRGRAAVHRVRHLWNPDVGRHRRRSLPERQSDDYDDDDATPTSSHPPTLRPQYRPRRTSHQRISADSDSDTGPPPRRPSRSPRRDKSPRRERNEHTSKHSSAATSPLLRHHRSHELPTSPREYFPPYYSEDERRHSIIPTNSDKIGGFAPSKAPFFAAQVSQLQQEQTRTSPRGAYAGDRGVYSGRPAVSYSRRNFDPIREGERERPLYTRAKRSYDRDTYAGAGRSQSHDPLYRDEDRSPPHRYVEGAKGRRYPVEAPWR